jgi:alpha-N-arabinofuranosidase
VLQPAITAPTHETARHGEVPLLDAVAVHAEPGVVLFAVNRSQTEPMSLEVDLRALPGLSAATHTVIADDDPDAVNTAQQPDRVTPRDLAEPKVDGGRLQVVLPALSWNMIRLS